MDNSKVLTMLGSYFVGRENKFEEMTKIAKELNQFETWSYIYRVQLPWMDFNKDNYRVFKIDIEQCYNTHERVEFNKIENTYTMTIFHNEFINTQRAIKQFAEFVMKEYQEEKDNQHKKLVWSKILDGVNVDVEEAFWQDFTMRELTAEEIPF